jgi:DNA-binding Xre family transcriptional regulator
MLKFNFKRVFRARGIDRPFSYLVGVGFSPNYATRIVNSRIRTLNIQDIEKLCAMLGCTPNDFLEWIPDAKDAANDKHPLIPLQRNDKVIQLTQMLNSIPLDKLREIESIINKEISQ